MQYAQTLILLCSIALIGIFLLHLIEFLLRLKRERVQTLADYAVSLVEEGVAYSEDKNRLLKRECAVNAGKMLKKEPVEILKDPIQVEKYMQKLLLPIRELAHNTAKEFILASVNNINDKKFRNNLKKILNSETVDDAIKFIIAGRKVGLADPLKTYFHKKLIT